MKSKLITNEYLQQQKTWLELFGLKGCYALEHFEVVRADGNRKVLRKRETPLEIYPDVHNTNALCATLGKSLGERMFGHEKEEDRLELINPSCNLEVKECMGEW